MQPLATDVVWSVSIGLPVEHNSELPSPPKTADSIVDMRYGLKTRDWPKEACVGWGPEFPQWKGQFWGSLP